MSSPRGLCARSRKSHRTRNYHQDPPTRCYPQSHPAMVHTEDNCRSAWSPASAHHTGNYLTRIQVYSSHIRQPAEPPSQLSLSTISFHTMIIIFLSAIQSISGACLALIHSYKQAVNTIKLVNQSPTKGDGALSPKLQLTSSPSSVGLQRSASSGLDTLPPSISRAPSVSSSISSGPSPPSSSSTFGDALSSDTLPQHYIQPSLNMVGEIFSMGDRFAASVLENTTKMLAAFFAPFLDR